MAKKLNMGRIFYSRLLAAVALLLLVFTRPAITPEMAAHALFMNIGLILIAVCVLGRVFSTVFLGGHKNETVITYGPFSVCRNPLYLFSLIGVVGVCFLSARLTFIAVIPYVMYRLYLALIAREEKFLGQKFGPAYEEYCAHTPRFWPKFSLYQVPESMTVYPVYVRRAVRDGLWWFAAYPAIGLVYYLQHIGIFTTQFLLP
jgi:protein-S-isoprenylcysteine O-methyltransferase Ste14